MTALDLFCGAGGAGAGIEAAGFDVVAAVDNDEQVLQTYVENMGETWPVKHDLSVVDLGVLPEMVRNPVYVHGSPPCKGFSQAAGKRDENDPRNSLVFSFIDWVEELCPKVVTMENVVGMTNITSSFMDEMVAAYREAGYSAKWRILNAADYGVPQKRRRVFTVAWRQGHEAEGDWFPSPTHTENGPQKTFSGDVLEPWVTVREAIGDLPEPGETPFQDSEKSIERALGQRTDGGAIGGHRIDEAGVTVQHRDNFLIRSNDCVLPEGTRTTDQINEAHQEAGRRPTHSIEEHASVIRAGTPPKLLPNHEDVTTEFQRENVDGGGKFDPVSVNLDEPSHTVMGGGGSDGRGTARVPMLNHDPRELTEGEKKYLERDPRHLQKHKPNQPGEPSRTIPANVHKGVPYGLVEVPKNHDASSNGSYEADDEEELEKAMDKPSLTIEATNPYLDRGRRSRDELGNSVETSVNERRIRRLTVRECARLQSFPDWFVFTGSKTAQYRQVGNAVPPLLQKRVVEKVKANLEKG